MFDDILENYTVSEYNIELLKGAQPYCDKPFPIPRVKLMKKFLK